MGRKTTQTNIVQYDVIEIYEKTGKKTKPKKFNVFYLLTAYLQENSTSSRGESRIASSLTKKFESSCLLPIPWLRRKTLS